MSTQNLNLNCSGSVTQDGIYNLSCRNNDLQNVGYKIPSAPPAPYLSNLPTPSAPPAYLMNSATPQRIPVSPIVIQGYTPQSQSPVAQGYYPNPNNPLPNFKQINTPGIFNELQEGHPLYIPDPCQKNGIGFKQSKIFPNQSPQSKAYGPDGRQINCYSQDLSSFNNNVKTLTKFVNTPDGVRSYKEVYNPALDVCNGYNLTRRRSSINQRPTRVIKVDGKNVACYKKPFFGSGGKLKRKKSKKNHKTKKRSKMGTKRRR
uniref:Uncharacterized protein n=1 Tax=viral metagenome TaxID=1070528 RepID=A0A6C0KZD5_9ZZZZ